MSELLDFINGTVKEDIEPYLKRVDEENRPDYRPKAIKNLGIQWIGFNDIRIPQKLLMILKDPLEQDECRSVSSEYLAYKVHSSKNIKDGSFHNLVDDIIETHLILLQKNYSKNNQFIITLISSILTMALQKKRSLALIKPLVKKKLDPKIIIELLRTIYVFEPNKKNAIKFFQKRLTIRADFKIHQYIVDQLDHYFRSENNDWETIEDSFIYLLKSKQSTFIKKAAEMLRDYGNREKGEKEVLEALETNHENEITVLLLASLGTLGNDKKETILKLNHFMVKGKNKQIQASAKSAIMQIWGITTHENWGVLINQYIEKPEKSEKKLVQFLKESNDKITYFVGFIVSIVFAYTKTILDFFLLDQNIKNIIGCIVIALLGVITLYLLFIFIGKICVERGEKKEG